MMPQMTTYSPTTSCLPQSWSLSQSAQLPSCCNENFLLTPPHSASLLPPPYQSNQFTWTWTYITWPHLI